jgi:Ca2+/Na+ antiporter
MGDDVLIGRPAVIATLLLIIGTVVLIARWKAQRRLAVQGKCRMYRGVLMQAIGFYLLAGFFAFIAAFFAVTR